MVRPSVGEDPSDGGRAVAADVHGKVTHCDGPFAEHVSGLDMATPTGFHRVSPSDGPSLIWTTAGDTGLTGIVTTAELRLLAVETLWVVPDSERVDGRDDATARMESSDMSYCCLVAWLDCVTPSPRRGRVVFTRGNHTSRAGLARRLEPFRLPRSGSIRVPVQALNGLRITATLACWPDAAMPSWPEPPPQLEPVALPSCPSTRGSSAAPRAASASASPLSVAVSARCRRLWGPWASSLLTGRAPSQRRTRSLSNSHGRRQPWRLLPGTLWAGALVKWDAFFGVGVGARRSNFTHGSTKAGLDAYGPGLAESLRGSGVVVQVVRRASSPPI